MIGSYWHNFWQSKTNGGHRIQSEDFLSKEAREKLFHLQGGKSLLDFGCGSGDLLVYYTKAFNRIVGVDFSPSMLSKAEERIITSGYIDKVTLIQGDETDIWDRVPMVFDQITAGQVVQYLNTSALDNFIRQASLRLADEGRIILFDIIDPRIFYLFELGLFSKDMPNLIRILARMIHLFFHKLFRRFRKWPLSELGYSYFPAEIAAIAARYDLNAEVAWSMYYEYRYHVILTKEASSSVKDSR